jgi:hypothetical protein
MPRQNTMANLLLSLLALHNFFKCQMSQQFLQITFVPASEYRGAKMDGWSPRKNRSMYLYIRPKEKEFLMTPSGSILSGCRALVVIHSTLNSFDARADIRSSWLKFEGIKESGISVIFLVGRLKTDGAKNALDNSIHSLQTLLKDEQSKHGDILQVKNATINIESFLNGLYS